MRDENRGREDNDIVDELYDLIPDLELVLKMAKRRNSDHRKLERFVESLKFNCGWRVFVTRKVLDDNPQEKWFRRREDAERWIEEREQERGGVGAGQVHYGLAHWTELEAGY